MPRGMPESTEALAGIIAVATMRCPLCLVIRGLRPVGQRIADRHAWLYIVAARQRRHRWRFNLSI